MKTLVRMLIAAGLTGTFAGAVVLSDNLSQSSSGTESVTATRWVTSSFGTDASAYQISTITVLMAQTSSGTAVLRIFTDAGGHPGTVVGTLTSPGSYSGSLANTTFTSSGIVLNPNTTYWVVLSAPTGSFNWSWTGSATGTGAGFQHTWGHSDDSGATWSTFTDAPQQMQVIVTGTVTTAVPASSTLSLLLMGIVLSLAAAYQMRQRGFSFGSL